MGPKLYEDTPLTHNLSHHRDREWQKWPVTIVTGAYIGWFVGRYAGGYLLRGKRIEFD